MIKFIKNYWWILLPSVLVAAYFLYKYLTKSEKAVLPPVELTKVQTDAYFTKFPPQEGVTDIGPALQQRAIAGMQPGFETLFVKTLPYTVSVADMARIKDKTLLLDITTKVAGTGKQADGSTKLAMIENLDAPQWVVKLVTFPAPPAG
jgi:hypothetical protein